MIYLFLCQTQVDINSKIKKKQVSVLPSAGKGLKHCGVSPGILQRNDFHHTSARDDSVI